MACLNCICSLSGWLAQIDQRSEMARALLSHSLSLTLPLSSFVHSNLTSICPNLTRPNWHGRVKPVHIKLSHTFSQRHTKDAHYTDTYKTRAHHYHWLLPLFIFVRHLSHLFIMTHTHAHSHHSYSYHYDDYWNFWYCHAQLLFVQIFMCIVSLYFSLLSPRSLSK